VITTWSATGHRPDLLGGYDWPDRDRFLIDLAKRELDMFRPDQVLVGMAQGWDWAVAYACLELKLPYYAAVPFEGQEAMWPKPVRDEYKHLLGKASGVEVICEGGFAPWKFAKRDIWMVDKTTGYILALWNGDKERGTYIGLKRAENTARSHAVINVWEDFAKWLKEQEWV